MDKLHNNANSLGLSIEMLFRGTDLDCNGSVTLENFKITLTKIRLSLSPSEVNKIAYIFDEECTGVIYKKSFM
jgi:Ca2+-binding EF-hand superfamily protein